MPLHAGQHLAGLRDSNIGAARTQGAPKRCGRRCQHDGFSSDHKQFDHVRDSGLEGLKPVRRRAKSLDNVRQRAPQLSFLTCDEDGTAESRTVSNRLRAFASNDLLDDMFGCGPRDTITPKENFFSLLAFFSDGHMSSQY